MSFRTVRVVLRGIDVPHLLIVQVDGVHEACARGYF